MDDRKRPAYRIARKAGRTGNGVRAVVCVGIVPAVQPRRVTRIDRVVAGIGRRAPRLRRVRVPSDRRSGHRNKRRRR
jgi:hypothetical protein